jgi:hypothetical protein
MEAVTGLIINFTAQLNLCDSNCCYHPNLQ